MRVYEIGKAIVETLVKKGHTAYFAGGWVRDLVQNTPSDEIDIATSARPEEIVDLFEKTVTVGISFGVVVVVIDKIHFEISTFRKDRLYVDGRHPEGVDFSTPEQDALRRDFTINGMFYDPLQEEIIDFVAGKRDLSDKIVRAIGEPYLRFQEDRLRMIRAIRFATRFNFEIEEKTGQAIVKYASELFPAVSIERIWQEFNKMVQKGPFDKALLMLHKYQLLPVIFPSLAPLSSDELFTLVAPFKHYPPSCPTILYLLQLFPKGDLQEYLQLCERFKVSSKESKWATFFCESRPLFLNENNTNTAFAHFYANSKSSVVLSIWRAQLPASKWPAFDKRHEKQQNRLAPHIERIKNKTPLITSALLRKEGVKPGKQMGLLLKEGEKIAIENDLDKANVVMVLLKKSPVWSSKKP